MGHRSVAATVSSVGHPRGRRAKLICPTERGLLQMEAAVSIMRTIAFKVVDERTDDLLVLSADAGEFAGTDAVGTQVGEDGAGPGLDVVEALLGEHGEQLTLNGDEDLGGAACSGRSAGEHLRSGSAGAGAGWTRA